MHGESQFNKRPQEKLKQRSYGERTQQLKGPQCGGHGTTQVKPQDLLTEWSTLGFLGYSQIGQLNHKGQSSGKPHGGLI